MLGAGAKPSKLAELLRKLDFSTLIGPAEKSPGHGLLRFAAGQIAPEWATSIWFDKGIHTSSRIEEWVDACLREVLGVDRPVLFSDLIIPTFVVSTDIRLREAKVWSQSHTPNESVARAVRASCAIPLFFQPVDDWQVDGGVLSNLPAFVFGQDRQRTLSSRILAFSVFGGEPQEGPGRASTWDYLMSIVDTVTNGATKLQGALQRDVHRVEIDSEGVKATDFDAITPQVTERLIANGEAATNAFLDEELLRLRPKRSVEGICLDRDELFARVTSIGGAPLNRVIISENKTDWVYALFPTLFSWCNAGVDLLVIVPEHGDNSRHVPYQRKLLEALGARLHVLPNVSTVQARAWIFHPTDMSQRSALIGLASSSGAHDIEAVHYRGELDSSAIDAVYEKAIRPVHLTSVQVTANPQILADTASQLLPRLRNVGQYGSPRTKLTVTDVPLANVLSMAKYVREFKYAQLDRWVEHYDNAGIALFDTAKIRFGSGKTSIVTPPVVERSGDNFILIEGTTRATYMRDRGYELIRCVVVEDVSQALPGGAISLDRVRVVGRGLGVTERYDGFDYNDFRHIESNVHLIGDL